MRVIEVALDAALGEVRRQGGPEYLLAEARSEGLSAARPHLDQLVDQVVAAIGNTHDGSELWRHMRQDPEAFGHAVRLALGIVKDR